MARIRNRSARQRLNAAADRRRWTPRNWPDHSGARDPATRRRRARARGAQWQPAGYPQVPPLVLSSDSSVPRTLTSRNLTRFGIVVPVHNEEHLVSAALDSLDQAVRYISESRVSVGIVVVLDRCSDRSSDLVSDWRNRTAEFHDAHHIEIFELEAGSVGSARSAGCQALFREWSHAAAEDIWLATTDADSEVPQDWIAAQLRMRSEGAQVWVGAVNVRDWSDRTPGTAEAWRCQYESEVLPIHGANFGIDATTYLEAGGFGSLATGEDRDLFRRAVALGATIRHDPLVRVVTSGRRNGRAPRGFAHALTSIEAAVPIPEPIQAESTAS